MMQLSKQLLKWYDAHKRRLPWRDIGDPYRIWVSEIMLQQTRVEAVISYYERFMQRCPSVHTLAQIEETDLLKLWEGLGYYSRARNMLKAAKLIDAEYHGSFPHSSKELIKLPGIGPYVANAVASIAFGECVPALDGNQARILARLLRWESMLKTPFDLLEPAQALMDEARPGDYNQALMDLGASVCLPKNPKCAICPWAEQCAAHADGSETRYPIKLPRAIKRTEEWTILLMEYDGAFAVQKRPDTGLLAGLYEFPLLEGHYSTEALHTLFSEMGVQCSSAIERLPDAKHVFTHLVWQMQGFYLRVAEPIEPWLWTREPSSLPFPTALKVYTDIMNKKRGGIP
ncbi:MAG: A/G-specific adenine glycosylase [Clostridia bacterium]|nr:A/G-specific adenine glycosylase [Clostridia bacterium]